MYLIADKKIGLLNTKPLALLSDTIWNIGFYGHVLLGGLALGIGWLQFNKKLRQKKLHLHRLVGKIYVFAALISGTCGIYIGFFATGGLITSIGFISLGIIWLSSTFRAYYYARKGAINEHQKMMIYSYAACFAAVTLRIWLPILSILIGEFIPAYKIVAWLSWVPNIIVAYFIVNSKQFQKQS